MGCRVLRVRTRLRRAHPRRLQRSGHADLLDHRRPEARAVDRDNISDRPREQSLIVPLDELLLRDAAGLSLVNLTAHTTRERPP